MSDGFNEAEVREPLNVALPFRVLATLPAEGERVPAGTDIQLCFNAELSKEARPVVTLKDEGGNVIDATIQTVSGGRALRVVPERPLIPGHVYRVSIGGALVSIGGQSVSTPVSWSFTVTLEAE